MESLLAGLALVIVGVVGAFFGYRLFRILLPVYGAVAGFVLAWGWWGESAWLLALGVGVAFAVILAILAYTIWSVFIGIAGVVFGFALGALIATTLNLGSWLAVALSIALAIAFGLLFVLIRNEMVIISTGLTGAASVARGVGEWFGLSGGFDAQNSTPVWLILLIAAVFIVVAVLGIRYQWGRYRRLNLYGRQAPAPTESPATRATSVPVAAGAAQPVAAAASAPAAVAAGVAVASTAAVAASEPVEANAEVGAAEPVVVEAAGEAVVDSGETPVEAASEVQESAAETPADVQDAVVETVADVQEGVSEAIPDVQVEALAVAAVAAAAVADTAEPQVDEAEIAAPEAASAESGAAAAILAAAADNKVEEVIGGEEGPEAGEDAVRTNVVEEVVKEIQETYSLEDIAKFREKLEFVEGIGPAYAEKLVSAGVNTVLDLLQRGATRKGRLELVEATGITGKLILRWVNHADLYRIKGVGSEYADLLEAAGVDTVVELAHRNAGNLYNAVVETNKVKNLVRKEPVASQVENWVEQAKQLPRVVQY